MKRAAIRFSIAQMRQAGVSTANHAATEAPLCAHRRLPLFVLCICLFIDCRTASGGGDDHALQERLMREAPSAWKEYKQYSRRLQGKYHHKRVQDRKLLQDCDIAIKQNEECQLCVVQSTLSKNPAGEVACYNPRYGFFLSRESSGKPWAVTLVADVSVKDKRVPTRISATLDAHVQALVRVVAHTDLLELLEYPTFQTLRVSPIVKDAQNLVKLEFNNRHSVKQEPFCPLQSGSLVLDPSHSWCLRYADLESTYYPDAELTTQIEMTIEPGANRLPIPKRVTQYVKGASRSEKWVMSQTVETIYELNEPARLPSDEEFTMRAFGLPEPFAGPPSRTRWYILGSLLGCVCLIAGIALRSWARSRAKSRETSR